MLIPVNMMPTAYFQVEIPFAFPSLSEGENEISKTYAGVLTSHVTNSKSSC